MFGALAAGLSVHRSSSNVSYTTLYNLHASLGLTVLALVGVRIAGRLIWRWPALPPGMSLWQRLLADATHTALYVLMMALPLVGWSIISAPGCCYAVPFVFDSFSLPRLPSTPFPDRAAAFAVHSALAWIAMGAIALHAAAAFLHHFVFKDDTLAHVIVDLRVMRSEGNNAGAVLLPNPAGPAASADKVANPPIPESGPRGPVPESLNRQP
jgi:cytochrome b561